MQNYKEIFTLASLDAINALYDSIPAPELPNRIKAIADYLREGYRYAANVKDDRVRRIDTSQHTDLIHTLHIMASEINKPQENFGIIIRHESGHQLAIAPFLDFCEMSSEVEWVDIVDNLEELMSVLSNYLNESNVWAFKECQQTVSYLHEMLSKINRIIQNS